jgi:hypothetical protein
MNQTTFEAITTIRPQKKVPRMVGMAEFKAYCTEHEILIACEITWLSLLTMI